MNDTDQDIFGEVADTETPTTQADPNTQLYLIPEGRAEWFVPKKGFDTPKDVKDCTTSLVVRFLSWKIAPENVPVYMGTGVAAPGILRNQLVVRYHPIPDGFGDGTMSGRVPCGMQFGESCPWCAQKTLAEKRFPRDKQPANYFKEVIAKFKSKDRTLMLGEIWAQDEHGNWATDGKIRAFEFANYLKLGRPFKQIIDDRANDADKRIRIDKKTYAGYVTPVAIKITWSWPVKAGKPEKGQYVTWTPTDATPFPLEAGGPDVSKVNKEWAVEVASHDPASWINRKAFPKLNAAEVGQWIYKVFTGEIKPQADTINVDTCEFGQLLELIEKNKARFDEANVNPAEYDYTMSEALRAIVKGVLNG